MQKIGKYVLTRQLGAGGMGVVYEGRDPTLNRFVAIKILPPDTRPGADARRFRREAEAAAQVNHPNCVQIYDIGEEDGRPFLVMELVSGVNAGVLIARSGRLSWVNATRVAVAACKGLTAIHEKGLIHRDVKPTNLLISEAGAVKLADFGLARSIGESTLSLTGEKTIGTPHYMSPEQCMSEPADARTDVYALGATYFHMLVGHAPFRGERDLQIMFAHCNNPAPDPCAVRPEVPPGCGEVIRKAMAKAPADRYQSATEMQEALEAVLAAVDPTVSAGGDSTWSDSRADLPPKSLPPGTLVGGSTVADTAPHPTRRRVLAAASAGILAAGGVGAYFALRTPARGEPPAPEVPAAPPPGPLPAPVAKENGVEVGGPVGALAVSPGGRFLAVGLVQPIDNRGGVKLFDLRAGGEQKSHDGERYSCGSVAFSSDGRYLAGALVGMRAFVVRELRDGELSGVIDYVRMDRLGGDPRAVAFSPDGKVLAVSVMGRVAFDGSVRLWRTGNWNMEIGAVKCRGARMIAYAPDGRTLAASVTDNQHAVIELWDTTTGAPVPADPSKLGNEPNFAKEEVGPSVAFARDKTLLALNRGAVIRLCKPPWYTETGPPIRAAAEPKTLALSPDGSLLAAGVGGAVELWNTATRAPRATFTGHKGSVLALAFSADGRTLYSGASMDTVVRIWKLPAPV